MAGIPYTGSGVLGSALAMDKERAKRVVRDAVAAVMRDPEVAKQLSDRGYQTIAGTPEDHQAQTNALVSQWIEIGKKVNLKE